MKKKFILILSIIMILIMLYFPYSIISVSAGSKISIYNKNNKEVKEITFTSQDITNPLKDAFEYCGNHADKDNILKISVPKGTYNISSAIKLCSNTILNLSDVTLTNISKSSNMFLSPAGYEKYSGLTNFKLEYGTLTYKNSNINKTTMIRLAHCSNITIQAVKFEDSMGTHFVELAAAKNFIIKDCLFKNLTNKSNVQALQIDILEESEHFRGMPPYDNTMNSGITVSNCIFTNVPSGIGTKSLFAGYYQDGIYILNNLFLNIRSAAITCTAYINSKINNNIIENCETGIEFFMMRQDESLSRVCITDNKGKINLDTNSEIKNNMIFCNDTGILIFGNKITKDKIVKYKTTLQEAEYPANNIRIKQNTIHTKGFGIRLYNTKNTNITANRIKGFDNKTGIGIYNTSQINRIDENTIEGPFEFGIYNSSNSNIEVISNNHFRNINKHAIINYGILYDIHKNTFTNISSFCIYYPTELCGYVYNNCYIMSYVGKVLY